MLMAEGASVARAQQTKGRWRTHPMSDHCVKAHHGNGEVLCIMVFELCCGTPCKNGSICSSSAALHEQHILVCHWITLLVRQCKPCAEVLDTQRTTALQCFFSMLQNQVYTLCKCDPVRNC